MAVWLRDIGSSIISSLLSRYINNVDPKQLTIAISKGELSLENVTVRDTALTEHQLPFRVVASRIGSIQVKIPFHYTTTPATIEIEDVDILLNVTGDVVIDSELTSHTRKANRGGNGAGFLSKMLYGVVEQIIANLRFKISNVHIRVEHNKGNVMFAGGLMIKDVTSFTINEDLEPVMTATTPDILLKQLQIEGLSVYMDTVTELIDCQNFSESMACVRDGQHDFVLENFGLQGILRHPKSVTNGFANEVTVKSEGVSIGLTRRQYVGYGILQREIAMFNLKRFYAKCGVPDRLPKSERSSGLWWRYTLKCTTLKQDPNKFNVDNALKFLVNRNRYTDLFMQSFDDPENEELREQVDELEDTLGETYTLLVIHAKAKWIMEKRKQPDISAEELEAAERSAQFATSGLKVTYEFRELAISLVTETMATAKFVLHDVAGLYTKLGAKYFTNCGIAEIVLLDRENDHVFEMLASDSMKCSELEWSNNAALRLRSITFRAQAPRMMYKKSFIDEVIAFTEKEASYNVVTRVSEEETKTVCVPDKSELARTLEVHMPVNLAVHFGAPVITIPAALPVCVVLGSVDIDSVEPPKERDMSNADHWYDHYRLSVSGFEILVGDKRVCEPVATNIMYSQLIVALPDYHRMKATVDVDLVSVKINRIQYLTFLTVMDMMGRTQVTQPVQTTEASQTVPPVVGASSQVKFAVSFKRVEMAVYGLEEIMLSHFHLDGVHLAYDVFDNCKSLELSIGTGNADDGQSRDLFAFVGTDASESLRINAKSDKNSGNSVTMRMSPYVLWLDLIAIRKTVRCFRAPSKRRRANLRSAEQVIAMATVTETDVPDDDDAMIIKKFETQRALVLDVMFDKGEFILPVDADNTLVFKTSSLKIQSTEQPERSLADINTFYDSFNVQLTDFSVAIGDTFILKPVSPRVILHHCFVNRKALARYRTSLEIEEIDVRFSRDHYLTCVSVPAILRKRASNLYVGIDVAPKPRVNTSSLSVVASIKRLNVVGLGSGKTSSDDNSIVVRDIRLKRVVLHGERYMDMLIGSLQVWSGDRRRISTEKAELDAIVLQQRGKTTDVSVLYPDFQMSPEWLSNLTAFAKLPENHIARVLEAELTVSESETTMSESDATDEDELLFGSTPARVSGSEASIKSEATVSEFGAICYGSEATFSEYDALSLGWDSMESHSVEFDTRIGDQDSRLIVRLKTPKIGMGFRGIDHRHRLRLHGREVVIRNRKHGFDIIMRAFDAAIDNRYVTKDSNINVKCVNGLIRVNIESLDLVLEASDYRFVMDMYGYFRYHVPADLPENPTDQDRSWNKIVHINGIHAKVNEDGTELFDVTIDSLNAKISVVLIEVAVGELYVEESMTKGYKDRSLVISDGFVAKVTYDTKDVVFKKNSKIFVKQVPINWIFCLIVYPSGLKAQLLRFERTIDQHQEIRCSFTSPQFQMMPIGCDYGVLKSSTVNFEYISDHPKSTIALTVGPSFAECDHMGVFHDFFSWDAAEIKLDIPNVTANIKSLKVGVQYDLFMTCFRYLTRLIAVTPERLSGPFMIPPYYFDIQCDVLEAAIIPRQMDDPMECMSFHMKPFAVKTGDEPRFICISSKDMKATSAAGKLVANVNDFATAMEFDLLDPDLLSEEDRESPYLAVHKFITIVSMSKCIFIYDRWAMATFLSVIQSFFKQELPSVDETDPFVVQYDTTFIIDVFNMEWHDAAGVYICTMRASGFKHQIYLQHDMTIKRLDAHRGDGPIMTSSREYEGDSVVWSMNANAMKLEFNHVDLDIDYAAVGRFMTAVMVSPILAFRVRPRPPDEVPNPEYMMSYTFNHSRFLLAVDPGGHSDIFIIDFDTFTFSMQNDVRYSFGNVAAMFSESRDSKPFPPISRLERIEVGTGFEGDSKVFFVMMSPVDVTIGSLDIVSFGMLAENIQLLRRELMWEPARVDNSVIIHTRYLVTLGAVSFSLSRANRWTAAAIMLLCTKFAPYNGAFSCQIDTLDNERSYLSIPLSSIVYINPKTGLPDEITEETELMISFMFTSTASIIKAEFKRKVALNVSIEAMNDILKFVNIIKAKVANRSIEVPEAPNLTIVNSTGVEGMFTVGDCTVMLQPMETKSMSLDAVPDHCKITYHSSSDDPNPGSIYLANLQYPSFINRMISVSGKRSRKGVVVTFSSLLRFKNNLGRALVLLVRQSRGRYRHITQISEDSYNVLPITESLDQRFAVTDKVDGRLWGSYHTFKISDIKKKGRIVNCTLARGAYRLLLSAKTDSATFIITITVDSLVVAINRLPFNIYLVISNRRIEMNAGEEIPLPEVRPSRSFKASITRTEVPGKFVRVNTGNDIVTEMPLLWGNGITSVAVDSMRREDSSQMQLVFYSPLIIFNRSCQALSVASADETVIHEFEPRVEGALPADDGIILWGSRNYFDQNEEEKAKSLQMRIVVPQSARFSGVILQPQIVSHVVSAYTLNPGKILKIVNPAVNDSFLTLHYNVASAEPYAKSKIMTIFSQIRVTNRMPFTISLQPVDIRNITKPVALGLPISVPAGEQRPVTSTCSDFVFGFFSKEYTYPVSLNFLKAGRLTFIVKTEKDPVLVECVVEERGIDIVATFRFPMLPQPLMIANTLDVDIGYSQYGKDTLFMPVAAHSTSIVAVENPYALTTISVHVLDRMINVDFLIAKVEDFGDFQVHVEVRAKGSQMKFINVTYKPIDRPVRFDMIVKLSIPDIHISLIDGFAREFLLFSMHHIQMKYMSTVSRDTVSVFIHSIQLEDLHPFAKQMYKVAIVGPPRSHFHFLEFRCSAFADAPFMTHFDYMTVRIQDIYAFLDICFISDVLNFVLPQKIGTDVLVPPEPSDVRSGISAIPVSVERLTVFNSVFCISVRTNTGRQKSYPFYSRSMRFIPNITNFQLKIPLFKSQPGHLSGINAGMLRKALVDPYQRVLEDQMGGIATSVDLLGRRRMVKLGGDLQQDIGARAIKKVTPMRPHGARAMARKQIKAYDPLSSHMQLMIQRFDLEARKYANETIEMLIDASEYFVCITQVYIFKIQGPQQLVIIKPHLNIKEVVATLNGDVVLVSMEDGSAEIRIPCESNQAAEQVATYLRSKRLSLKLEAAD